MISAKFLEDIQKFGKQISLKITIDDNVFEKDRVISCTKSFNGDMFKSIMQYVDVELSGFVDVKDKEINIEFGVCVEAPYEYISWGSFIVDNETIEKSIDKNTTKFTAYDYLCKSCVDYVDLNITYPIIVKEYLNVICEHLGYTLQTQQFINSTKTIDEEKFLAESYTFRDVLDHIAGATASVIVTKDNKLYIKYPTDIGMTIDENNLKSMNLQEKFGPVNSIVLSLQPQEDNYYMQDAESIEINGLTEIKISNNEILNKHREEFANEIFENLNGWYFYPFEIESFGFAVFEPYDLIHIKDTDGNTYQSVVLNDTITVTTGINEKFYTVRPEVSETDYSKATQDKKLLYRTILEVDKQNKQIIANIQDVETSVKEIKNTINVSLSLNYVNTQTRDEELDKYYPDYTVNPLKITAIAKDTLKEVIANAVFTFKRKGQNDEEFVDLLDEEVVNNNVLTISHNLTESTEYIAYATLTTEDGTILTTENSISINYNLIKSTEVDGSMCSIVTTTNDFIFNESDYEPNNIVLTPQLFGCNFNSYSYSTDLGLSYSVIEIGNEIVEEVESEDGSEPQALDGHMFYTNIEGVHFNNETNELIVQSTAKCFDLTNVVIFKLKTDVQGYENTTTLTKTTDVNYQLNNIMSEINALVEENKNLSLQLDGLNNTISTKVEEIETTYTGDITSIKQQLSNVIQTATSIEEQFTTLKEIIDENGNDLQTITTYIRKTAKGIEVGELDANVKTLMGTSYFAILFNNEEKMTLEQNLLTIENVKALMGFQLGNSIFTSHDNGFYITWGGD